MAQQLRALISSDCDVQVVQDAQSLMVAVGLEMPDIVITDITMPGNSGLAAARDILAAHPEARIIFVSVRVEPAVIRQAMAQGARGYVVKADAGDELANAVQAVLDGGSYVSASAQDVLKRGR
ncbi:response regulator transcription factor [Bradyrhizobium sp. Pha-3]|uniref:response regulator n=1 Tax=Bradyrhizobium sp. Pha-3 TaxID=208375 RepID=UPI0035D522A4